MCLYELFFVQKPISSFPLQIHTTEDWLFCALLRTDCVPDTLYSHISAAKVGHGGHDPNQPVVHVFFNCFCLFYTSPYPPDELERVFIEL